MAIFDAQHLARLLGNGVFKEMCCFGVLVLLVVAQVMIDQFGHHSENRYHLSIDKAKLIFENNLTSAEITVLQRSGNCYKCTPMPFSNAVISPSESLDYTVDTTYPTTIFMKTDTSACNVTHHFREHSLHYFNFSQGEQLNCSSVSVDDEGDHTFLPVLYATITIGLLSLMWIAATQAYRIFLKRKSDTANVQQTEDKEESPSETNTAPIQNKDPYKVTESSTSPLMYGSVGDQKQKKSKQNSARSSPAIGGTLKSSLITKGTSDSGREHTSDVQPKVRKRLHSLDAFRGLSLTVMVFVNYGGGGYYFFQHSKWNGLTVADLVFPWFVWIMGVSLVFSFHARRKDTVVKQVYQILRRTVILFGFGLFFISNDTSQPLSQMRLCGVLQRLAATFFVVAITEVLANQIYRRKSFTFWSPLKDVSGNWVQWVIVVVLEALSLMITFLVHNKGCPRGYLGPGGISELEKYRNCTGGAERVIDYWILGESHIYQRNTAKTLYHLGDQENFEPEGILGTLNSVVLCYLGVQAGRTMLLFRGRHSNIVARFLVWGIALSTLATLLCLGLKNGGLIPINKNMWSLSYVLLMAGFAYIVLSAFYLIMDVRPIWNGAPFIYPGMNSILVYMGHEILHQYFPFSVYGQKISHMTFLSSNLIAVAIWLLISYYLYTVHFFFKV